MFKEKITFNYNHDILQGLSEVTVGNRIRKQRLLKGISQEDLALAIAVADGTMDTYEFDRAFPSPKVLIKIADNLNIPLEYFYDDYYRFIFTEYDLIIKEWIKSNNLTTKHAAKVVGVSENVITNWKYKRYYPDRVQFEKLKAAMNLDPYNIDLPI
jgi:transcriptional regulator with XRE-family HTH domain